MDQVWQMVQGNLPLIGVVASALGLIGYINRDLLRGKASSADLPRVLPGVFRGEVLPSDDADETDKLREALKTLTCHVALSIDDPAEQATALNACRTLKKHIPAPAELPSRPPQAIENQEALLAAVAAYNTTAADKIPSVG